MELLKEVRDSYADRCVQTLTNGPQVTPQLPFWGDVSPYSRREAACSLIATQRMTDGGHRGNSAVRPDRAVDATAGRGQVVKGAPIVAHSHTQVLV
jgi:hypothetical protein